MLRKTSLVILISCSLFSCSSTEKKKRLRAAELHLQLGISYINQQNYPTALKELLRSKKLDPHNSVIQNNLGLIYFLMKRYSLSRNHLQRAVNLSPKYTEARNNLGRVLIEIKKYPLAKKHLLIAQKDLTYPYPEKNWINLGLLEFQQKNFYQAKKLFLKSIKVKRKSCLGHYMYGRSLYELKKYPLSAISLDKAIKICKSVSFPEPYYYSALSYYNSNLRLKAKNRFKELLKYFPESSFSKSAKKFVFTVN